MEQVEIKQWIDPDTFIDKKGDTYRVDKYGKRKKINIKNKPSGY
jgi:hypothetical protein